MCQKECDGGLSMWVWGSSYSNDNDREASTTRADFKFLESEPDATTDDAVAGSGKTE